jgi:iron complex outermembrane recepter protein
MTGSCRKILFWILLQPLFNPLQAAEETTFYSIKQQALASALIEFARQSRFSVLIPGNALEGIVSGGIHGHYQIQEGLEKLLDNTGIEATVLFETNQILVHLENKTNNKNVKDENMMSGSMGKRGFLASAIAAIISGGTSNSALSQSGSAGSESEPLQEIAITGSRIQRTGMTAPTPVTTMEAEELELLSPGTLMDQLDFLPQFVNNNTLENASAWTGTGGQSTLNLRGVGTNRTLILLDGRRVVPSNRLSTVDISMFPQALIKRTEVVTGGASAAYGSDAISGVVNFIIDRDFEGMTANVQGGISELSDRQTGRYSMAGGFGIGDRTHVVMATEYFHAGGIPNYNNRDWYQSWGDINYGATRGVPNQTPQRIRVENTVSRNHTLGGLIWSGPLAGTHFLDDGTPAKFFNGDVMDFTATSALARGQIDGIHVGGRGSQASGDQVDRHHQVLAPQVRGNFYANIKHDINDNNSFSLQGIYGDGTITARKAGYIFSRPLDQITIFQDNAFLPEELRQQMIANNVQSFQMRKQVSSEDILNNSVDGAPMRTTMFSLTASLDGSFSNNDWNYSAYYQYGESLRHLKLYGHRNDRTYRAIDAVRDPRTGQIICRSTLSEPNDGCVPLNMFGRNNETQQARDYIHDVAFTDTKVSQHAAEIVLNGSPTQTWAGPVYLATGVSYRKDFLDQIGCDVGGCPIPLVGQGPVDTPRDANGNPIYRGLPPALVGRQIMELTTGALIVGGFDVKEVFGEFLIPLARDLPAAESVDLTLAARYANYQGSGGIWAWKAGIDWQIFDDLRFRLTRSRDVRAASLAERYDQSTGGANVTDPFLNDAVYIVSTMQGGNPNVLPEYADTLTFGLIYQPSWLPGFSASTDFYDIQLTNAISLLGLADIVNECFRVGAFCDMINRDATGLIQTVRNIYINIDKTRTTGMDVELQYRQPISLFGGDESIRLRTIGSRLMEASITPYIGDKIDSAGVLDFADWQVMLSATYIRGPLSVSWTENWRSRVKRDRLWQTGIDVDNVMIASQSMSNLRVNYGFEGPRSNYSLYAMVSNVFDRNPSRVMGLNNIWGPIGRNYTVGLNYRY